MKWLQSLAAALAVWACAAGLAAAQETGPNAVPGPPSGAAMSAAEVRAALLGYELTGEVVGAEGVWTECIDPHGRTWWRMDDFAVEGRVQVKTDGHACFRYADSRFRREICWEMRRLGQRFRFDLVGGESLPLVVTARRQVSVCRGDGPMA